MTKQFTIYGLRLKGDREARYIGQTNGEIEVRLAGHFRTATRPCGCGTKVALFFAWLRDNEPEIEAFKIGYADTREEALGIEKAIIALCLRLDHRLFNQRGLPA